MQKLLIRAATGTTDSITIAPSNILTFAAIGDVADYTLTAQVKLTDNGAWFDAQVMTDGAIYSTVSGARAIRFNLSALGTASVVDIEVTGSDL
jgi:hypothetical protein